MRGRIAFSLAAAAVGWCLFLIVASFTVAFYANRQCTPIPRSFSTRCVSTTSTAFAVNGWIVIFYLIGVALASCLVFVALRRICSRTKTRASFVAWLGIVLLLAFSYVTGFSIGPAILPGVLLLAFAAIVTPRAIAAPAS
jgi:hypothetical protein